MRLDFKESKKGACSFCKFENPLAHNFCGNCGADLRQTVRYFDSDDLIELTISRIGRPPTPIELLPGENCLYICQVLSQSDNAFAAFVQSPKTFRWDAIERQIGYYTDFPDLKDLHSCLFVMDHSAKGGKK